MSLHLFGASVRAAAQSASRAGITAEAFDLFADRDLAATCRAERVDRESYPEAFEAIARASSAPWMYTGALENHPDLIDRIAAIRPLWGIGGAVLRAVRDPSTVRSILTRRGLLAPECRTVPEGLPRDGSWLVKPRSSAGGRSIRPLTAGDTIPSRPSFYQERIEGQGLAALYVGQAGRSRLLGVTRQILGREGEPFAYAGSLGPSPVAASTRDEIEAIGAALVDSHGLTGLFGVDLVARPDGRPVAIEVNPRYTASVEVLELASGRPLLVEHRRAFERSARMGETGRSRPPKVVGKAILFADRRSMLPALEAWRPRAASFAVPAVADVPESGTVFEAGDPVLTVLARGSTAGSCEARLMARLGRWRGRLRPLE